MTIDITTRGAAVGPIRRKTLTAQVTEQLRDGIYQGVFPPGTQLQETELAERLGVSRGPVRESLQRLIQEGLLVSQPHRGVFVPVLTEDDVVDIFFAREAVEAAAFRRVISAPASAELIDALRRVIDDMASAVYDNNWPAVGELDVSFHRLVVEAAGSHRLRRMFDTLISETRLCLNMQARSEPTRLDLLPEHRELVDLIAGADLDTALTTLRRHFDEAVVTLRHRLRHATVNDANGVTQQRRR